MLRPGIFSLILLVITTVGCGKANYTSTSTVMESLSGTFTGNIYKMMTYSISGNRLGDCSHPNSWLVQVVSGGGPAASTCIAFEGDDRCDDDANWVRLSRIHGWKYSKKDDTWSRIDYLNNGDYIGPGIRSFRIRSSDSGVERAQTVGIESASGADTCYW